MKCKYRVRWFSSKGAFLVLLWTMFISITLFSLVYIIKIDVHLSEPMEWLYFSPVLTVFVSVPLSGWLADAKFGKFKVFSVGAILLFVATVTNCLFLILEGLVWEGNHALKLVRKCLSLCFLVVSGCACLVTALPLGLDQLPDASSSSIAGYIAWFVCSLYIGGFVGDGLQFFQENCIDEEVRSGYTLIWALLLVLCMSIVLASIFLFSSKWLIIEPKSPQSLRTIYHVLQFATRHKAPLNRSALTYWEEDIPSRIDLGKSKYGGPFTTEQVEDVKTVLRLLIISPVFALIGMSFILIKDLPVTFDAGLTTCINDVISLFLNNSYCYGLLGSVIHEFLIYPIIDSKLPSILKRIGAASLLVALTTFICFILKLALYLSHSSGTEWIAQFLHSLTLSTLTQYVVTLILEFMCAQSPYNMRGLMLSLTVLLLLVSSGVQSVFNLYFTTEICTQPWCPLVSYSIELALQIIGFLLFCIVAHWYKRRVRDDYYSAQQVVEEVYDRYLTAAAEHSRLYGSASS